MATTTDPADDNDDDATAALIARMIAVDLDDEDAAAAALDFQGNYSGGYEDYGDYDGGDGEGEEGDYDDHHHHPDAEHEFAADSTWEQYYYHHHPDESSTAQVVPDGTWDSSEAPPPLPAKRSTKKKQAVAQNQQHGEDPIQADEVSTAAGSNRLSIANANERPNPIPDPLIVNRAATTAHEDSPPHQPPSNAPGKRRADSPPAYCLPHRPRPFSTLSPPTPYQPTEPDTTNPASTTWGEPAPGSEDWELLELQIPWPGSERGGRRVADMEEGEDAAVVEVRVAEGEDLWSLLGELLCLGGEGEGGGKGDMEGEGGDGFRGLRGWGLEGWVVGGVR